MYACMSIKGLSIQLFARLISNSFYENSNLPNIHYDMLACLCNLCVVFVKLSDKLSCDQREDGSHVLDQH